MPETREAEVLRFIDRGLSDISLSRNAARSGGWGIPFPGAADQVVYVWIDALVNYLSGLEYPSGVDVRRFWEAAALRQHVIGKNVWKFHGIYWPALLLSAGLAVPDKIFVHGFLTSDGEKISKSAGGSADPVTYVRELGADAVRFFLLHHVRPFEDADFSAGRLAAAYQSDLANALGNLCSRLTTLCDSAELPGIVRAVAPPAPRGFHESVESYRWDLALDLLWEDVRELNRDLTSERPWEDVNAGRQGPAREKLTAFAVRLDTIAYWLQPFLPATAGAIHAALAAPSIRKCAPLFPRR